LQSTASNRANLQDRKMKKKRGKSVYEKDMAYLHGITERLRLEGTFWSNAPAQAGPPTDGALDRAQAASE